MQHRPKFRASWEAVPSKQGSKRIALANRKLDQFIVVYLGEHRSRLDSRVEVGHLSCVQHPSSRLVFVATRGEARPRPSGKGEHEARPLPLRPTPGYGRSLNFRSGRLPGITALAVRARECGALYVAEPHAKEAFRDRPASPEE